MIEQNTMDLTSCNDNFSFLFSLDGKQETLTVGEIKRMKQTIHSLMHTMYESFGDNCYHVNVNSDDVETLDLRGVSDAVYLTIVNQKIKRIVNIPRKLEILEIRDCDLEELTDLPENLHTLRCSNCKLKSLKNLPKDLIELSCHSNQLENLDVPDSVEELNCSNNKLNELTLPSKLISLNYSKNKNLQLTVPKRVYVEK